MMKWLRMLLPRTLKYRLVLSFVLTIMLPLIVIQFYHFRSIEQSAEHEIMKENARQLTFLKENFEATKMRLLSALITLEKDPLIMDLLTHGALALQPDTNQLLYEKFNYISNRFEDLSGIASYLFIDPKGNLYSSQLPEIHTQDVDVLGALQEEMANPKLFAWLTSESPEVAALIPYIPSNSLVLYSTVSDSAGQVLGISVAAFSYQAWLNNKIALLPLRQVYFFLDQHDRVLFQTESGKIDVGAVRLGPDDFASGRESSRIISLIRLDSLQWKIGSELDLHYFLGDIEKINRQFVTTLVALTLLFMVTTFFLSSLLTRPLQMVRRKMETIVKKNMLEKISDAGHTREIKSLIQSFNQMTVDMTAMIQKLKEEERQRQAMRYQILFQQMNPHFLLNTINVIKWTAMDKGIDSITDICVSLGKLMEMGIHAEIELIHLKDEIQYIESYIRIQQIRYGHKLRVVMDVQAHLSYALVPKFSLQPLVENAIMHGIAPKKEGGEIVIRICRGNEDELLMDVQDDGYGFNPGNKHVRTHGRKGIGLSNLRERLDLLFQAKANLTVSSVASGTLARIRIPLLVSVPNAIKEES